MVRSRSCRAFTLIELLVVIAIIVLLVAILMPTLSAARERTRGLICRTQLRELSRAAFEYASDFGAFPPCIDNYSASGYDTDRPGLDWLGIGNQFGPFVPGNMQDPWTGNPRGFASAPRFGLLWPYMQNEDLILCPADVAGPHQPNQVVGSGNGKFSYTMVAGLGLRAPERISMADHFVGDTVSASDAPLFVEEHPDGANNDHREGNFWNNDKLISRHGPFEARPGIRPGQGNTGSFLQGRTNVGFADGHVEPLRTNFGFGLAEAQTPGYPGIANDTRGLLFFFGVKYELLTMLPQ